MLTFCLGLTFLLTQVIEYHRLGFNTGDTSFAATFFGLTGLHGAHVFVGLTILMVMTVRAFRATSHPSTTTASSSAGSTGTSSTSCGSSSTSRCTSSRTRCANPFRSEA